MAQAKSRFAAAYEAHVAAEQAAADRCAARRESVPEARGARRSDHAEPAEMWTTGGPVSVWVQNLSISGASVHLPAAAAFGPGESVSLRLCDGRYLHGRVVRVDDNRIGVMFDDELATVDEILHFETRGAAVYSGMARHATRQRDG